MLHRRFSLGDLSLGSQLVAAFMLLAAPPMPAMAQGAGDLCSKFSFAKPPAHAVKIRYGLTGGGEEPLALLWADKTKYPNHGRFYDLEPQVFAANDRMTAVQAGQLEAGSISLTAKLICSQKITYPASNFCKISSS